MLIKKLLAWLVVRDEKGSFLAALNKQMQTEVSPVVAKTFVVLHAVMFCKEQGYLKAWSEGDALQVVKEVNSEFPYDSMLYAWPFNRSYQGGSSRFEPGAFHPYKEGGECCSTRTSCWS